MDFEQRDTIMTSDRGPATETMPTGPTVTTANLQRGQRSSSDEGTFDIGKLLAKLLASDQAQADEARLGIDHVAVLGED